MHFEPIDGKTQFTKLEMIAGATRRHFQMSETQFERWIDWGLIGKHRSKKRKEKAYWSLQQMHLLLKLLEMSQQPGVHPIDLCTIPTWGWLYLGDEADIQLDQMERVMWTWQAIQLKHPLKKMTRDVTRTTIGYIASDHADGKRQLMDDIIHLSKTREFPEPEVRGGDPREEFVYHLETVIDPQGRKEHNGPRGAPLTAEVIADHLEITCVAIKSLASKESLPRRYWTTARTMLLYTLARYLQEQPQFAREVSGKPSAALFQPLTMSDILTSACRELRLVLGYIISRPELCAKWEQVEMRTEVVISPLLLPNGNHYSYLRLQEH